MQDLLSFVKTPDVYTILPSTLLKTMPCQTTLSAHLLGSFRICINNVAVENRVKGRSASLLKYLLAHPRQSVSRDTLMELFWPETPCESARNSLNVALHGVRQTLRAVSELPLILHQDGSYKFNPAVAVWLDAELFEEQAQNGQRLESAGQLNAATSAYERAIHAYTGDFMADDPYADWAVYPRERLRILYLHSLDRLGEIYFAQQQYDACIQVGQWLLARDNCREDAHCRLMRCYSRQQHTALALRQYQLCVKALRAELDVSPDPRTTQLYEQIRRHQAV